MAVIDSKILTQRVKGRVSFSHYVDGALWYRCSSDKYEFPVPLSDTTNAQGSSPTFWADDKAIVFMRWIRKSMEADLNFSEQVSAKDQQE